MASIGWRTVGGHRVLFVSASVLALGRIATAVLASLPPIILLLVGQRQIAAGLMGGAVKE